MIAIPAIDLINGQCVRLTEGVFNTAKRYGMNPAAMARKFAQEGANRLHVVDLDAARGQGNNRRIIADIRRSFTGKLDVGGGVRTAKDVRELLDLGIDIIVLGTALARTPKIVRQWTQDFGTVFSAGIDARDGEVKISGWEKGSSLRARDLAVQAGELGMVEIIYTDIARDGTLKGPNLEETQSLAGLSGIPVVISGGVGGMEDLKKIARVRPTGIEGVIIGKALYEGRVDLKEAIGLFGAE